MAISAAREAADGELLLVPRFENERYAAIGTVAKVEDVGRLQNGLEALVIRGLHRATIGTGVAGTGDAEVSVAVDWFAEWLLCSCALDPVWFPAHAAMRALRAMSLE